MSSRKQITGEKLNEAQKLMSGIYSLGAKEEEKSKQSWDDLEGLFKACSEALVISNREMVEMYSLPGVVENIENRQEVSVALNGLHRDINAFSEELKQIHALHINKTGFVTDENELSACIQIFELYFAFQTRYQSVIIPTVVLLAEEAGKAAVNIQRKMDEAAAEKQLTPEQDPNIVTDVAVKEPVEVINQPTEIV